MKINYIIGTYLGPKRMMTMDGIGLVRKHLDQLTKLKHNIDKIYIVMPPAGNTDLMFEVVKEFPNLNTEIMIRDDENPNKGFCFGSWNYCLWKTADEADYSVLVLDDYIPVMDNFDSILLKYFDNEKVVYVCQLHKISTPLGPYGGEEGGIIGNGIFKNKVFKKCGGFYLATNFTSTGESYHDAAVTQSSFMKNIVKMGYEIRDTIKDYKAFMDRTKKISLFGNRNNPDIFRPIECFVYDCFKYIDQTDKKNYEYVTECSL